MAATKTTTLTYRIEPGLKEAVRTAAELEHRSITNMIEVMIREYCARVGVDIPKQGEPSSGSAHRVTKKHVSTKAK